MSCVFINKLYCTNKMSRHGRYNRLPLSREMPTTSNQTTRAEQASGLSGRYWVMTDDLDKQ